MLQAGEPSGQPTALLMFPEAQSDSAWGSSEMVEVRQTLMLTANCIRFEI